MTDSQEETVDCQIITLFIRFAHTFHQVHAFHAVIPIQPYRIMFKQHFDFLILHHPFLHDLGSTQEWFTYNQIHFTCQASQIRGFLTSRITSANYRYDLLTIKETVAGGTSADTHTGILLLIFQSQVFGSSSGCNNNGLRLDNLFLINGYLIRRTAQISSRSHTVTQVCAETLGLPAQIVHHLRAADAFRITGEILYIGSGSQLPTGLQPLIKHRRKIGARCINSSCISGRTGTYDQTLYFFCFHIILFIINYIYHLKSIISAVGKALLSNTNRLSS